MSRGTRSSIRLYQGAGALLLLLLVGGFGGWSASADLSSAVMAPASVTVASRSKKIQHKEGGIVAELYMRQGDRVSAGQLLVRLDATETRANLAIITRQLDELGAESARLLAEQSGSDLLVTPPELQSRAGEARVSYILAAQRHLLEAENETQAAQKAQLEQQVAQFEEEIEGLKAQSIARAKAAKLLKAEVEALTGLRDQGLVTVGRYNALLRERTDTEGELGRLKAEMARARNAISETGMKILQLDQDRRARILTRLGEVRTKVSSLEEQKIAAEARLKRIDIVAPISGVVHELAVHTIGGVIAPGETLMLLVPEADEMVLEARIEPKDVDDLHVGQKAVLRFPSFNQRTTPEVSGQIDWIGADLTLDPASKQSFFTVRISLEADQLARLGDNKLHPGMPAEAFVATGSRSALSYLLRPLQDQFSRAFREQ